MFAAAAAMIVVAVGLATAGLVYLAVGRTVCGAEAAAALRFCGRREHIHREADALEVTTGIAGGAGGAIVFRHTSAQRIYQHIYCAEQLYNSEQSDTYIDCHRSTHCGIPLASAAAAVVWPTGITAGITRMAGMTARIAQLCLKGNGFAFCNNKWTAIRIAAAVVQVGGSGYIRF